MRRLTAKFEFPPPLLIHSAAQGRIGLHHHIMFHAVGNSSLERQGKWGNWAREGRGTFAIMTTLDFIARVSHFAELQLSSLGGKVQEKAG